MFEDSLVESSGRLGGRHPWSTIASFAGQSLALAFLLLLSLVYTQSLPQTRRLYMLNAPAPSAAAPAPARRLATSVSRGSVVENVLVVPREIPKNVLTTPAEARPRDNPATFISEIPGAIPGDNSARVVQMLRSAQPQAPRLAIQTVRVSSGVAQGMLIRQVKPQYPATARLARVEGTVILQAVVGKDGTVKELRLISGHPLLAPAAIDAVQQWRYRPYHLNGEAVEVETCVKVIFTLTHD